jgi:rhombotail lipoprotein
VARLQSHCSGYQPYLAAIDAKELTAWEEVVRGQREIVNVQPITGFQLQDRQVTLHGLRSAAAELHCELLLVYLQADSQVDNMNDAAVLYWSIIGLWIAPGNVVEHKTVAQAVLLDCRTGQILGTATGDHYAKRLCPAAFTDQRQNELARESEEKALTDLRTACKGLIARTVAAAVATRTNPKR